MRGSYRNSGTKRLIIQGMMLLFAGPLLAQSDTTSVRSIVAGTLKIEQATQKRRDAWGAERAQLEARYVALQSNAAFLADRRATSERQLSELQSNILELQGRVAQAKRLEGALRDTVQSIEVRLERSMSDGLPFLFAERGKRLGALKAELAKPEAPSSELIRRLLEALQFEAAYGSTADVTGQRLAVGRDSVSAQVLRIGRLALFWRSNDGKRVGRYDDAARAWVELPSKYVRDIGQAMEMASHLRPGGIVSLPVGRMKP